MAKLIIQRYQKIVRELLSFTALKISASILALLLGFFILQPVFGNQKTDDCASKTCCSKNGCPKNKPKKDEPIKNDCGSNGCNPFLSCACVNFFVVEKIFVITSPASKLTNKTVAENDKRLATIERDCWHPPEMI